MTLRRWVWSTIAIALAATGCGSNALPPGQIGSLVNIGAGVKGPSGLRATVYATGLPSVSALAFDAHDRLWVATAEFEDSGRDALYVVSAAGAPPTKVIGELHTPMGLLWHDDSLFVASAEGVDVYGGFDGTQFARHQRIVELPTNIGKPGSLVLAPDGHLLMGISAPCDSCTPAYELSAAIVSFLPDGTDLEVFARDIRAPVGLAFFPQTDDLFVTMNQRDDLDPHTPGDWLAVVHEGESWGFPACYGQGGSECTGVPAALAELDPHAAVSGVAIVTGQLGPAVGTAAVVAEWAEGKVQRVALTKSGDTYTATVTPFLSGLKNPVPVVLSAKGAVLVGDWSTGNVIRVEKE